MTYPDNMSKSSWFIRYFCVAVYCSRENAARNSAWERYMAESLRSGRCPDAPPNQLATKGFG